MSWSYSGNPSTTDKDAVRWNCGLTDSADQLVTDEEIEHELATYGVLAASIRICRRVAAKFSRRADQSVGDYSERFSQRAENFRQTAMDLEREKRTAGVAGIVAGGISKDDKQSQEDDDDRVKPRFKRNQFDTDDLKP